jgi:ribosomal protein L13
MKKYSGHMDTGETYIIKDAEGNIVTDEPLSREDYLVKIQELNGVKAKVEKKEKKVKKSEKIEEE